MKKNNIVSVIIPAFNCEKTIEKCINSIIHQTYQNIQVIVINDGSTDNTKEIVNNMANLDSRILLINQKNCGVSTSRNNGLDRASGDFVMFVDSDDYILENAIEKMMEVLDKYSVDLVRCDYTIFNDSSNQNDLTLKFNNKNFEITGNRLLESEFLRSDLWYTVWGQLIKKDKIRNIKFAANKTIGEDLLFNYFLYQNVDKIYYLDQKLYMYYFNKNGITKKMNLNSKIKNFYDTIDNYIFLYKEFQNNELNKQIILNQCVCSTISYQRQLIFLGIKNKNILKQTLDSNEELKKFYSMYNGKKHKFSVNCINNNKYWLFIFIIIIFYVPLKKIKSIIKI